MLSYQIFMQPKISSGISVMGIIKEIVEQQPAGEKTFLRLTNNYASSK